MSGISPLKAGIYLKLFDFLLKSYVYRFLLTICVFFQMSLIEIAEDTAVRDERLGNINKFCSPELVRTIKISRIIYFYFLFPCVTFGRYIIICCISKIL